MTTRIIAIDPGQSGAIAVVENDGFLAHLEDLNIIRDGRLAWVNGGWLNSMLMQYGATRMRVVVERVSSMPKQGVASAFNFGVSFGSVLSLVQAHSLPLEFVTASVWKRAFGLSSDKRASLDKARLLYPHAELHLAKHEGRAEALLIAHWALTRSVVGGVTWTSSTITPHGSILEIA